MQNVFICIVFLLIFTSCGERAPEILKSPSGNYFAFASESKAESSSADYGLVVVHLLDKNQVEIQTLTTRASVFQGWALGWMPEEDILILQSSDINDLAFSIENQTLVKIGKLSEAMLRRSSELHKKEKSR